MEVNKYITQIIDCKNCSLCCNNASVFILSDEVDRMKELDVPINEIDGRYFIKQKPNGRCPNLTIENRCKIYDQRPIACKLHPFYLMNRRGLAKTWVKYSYCPDENKILKDTNNRDSFRLIAYELEKCFSSGQILEMLKSDEIDSKYDRLETGATEFIEVMKLTKHCI
jgi:Fe-S-cluster containining protein